MKTLITWIGFREDFKEEGSGISADNFGFTATIQKDIITQHRFERHIILTTIDRSNTISSSLERRNKCLLNFLRDTYPNNNVEVYNSEIDKSELQDFKIIETRLRSFIQHFPATDELHIIAGTGPTAVGMAWCTLCLAMNNRFRLHVLQRPEYTPDGKVSDLVGIEPYVSQFLDDKLRESHFNKDLPDNIFQDDIVVKEYFRARSIAPAADVNVLLLGETGCGKDRMAEFIVKNSPLDINKYKAINCASLPDDLLYSELFGHMKGAFTGASDNRKGLFEECNGGTLFLDEIGDISPFMQQSLLRAIENGQIKRAGSNEVLKEIKVRIIAATNNNLYQKCKDGKFRWDLYYRLCTMEICLEPYRNRTDKNRQKAIEHYLQTAEKKWGREIKFSKEATKAIENYSFPGNFREIYNTMNGLFALGKKVLDIEDLPKRFFDKTAETDETYDAILRKHCLKMYEKYNKDLGSTCKALGYKNQTQLKKKLEGWSLVN